MKVKVGDVELFYRIEGDGDPCLAMHGGLGADHTLFLNTPFHKLSRRLKLIYYDHRCNGRSSCPSIETLTHENLAKDADALRKVLDLENITVIGHSYGGIVALEYALRYQAHLRRLILIATTPSKESIEEARKNAEKRGASPEMMKWVDLALKGEIKDDDKFQEAMTVLSPLYFYDYESIDKKEAEKWMKDVKFSAAAASYSFKHCIPKYDIRDRLHEIKVPTLILCGRHDWICPASQAVDIHAGIQNSELIIFEKSRHWPYIEETGLFMKTVLEWLDRT